MSESVLLSVESLVKRYGRVEALAGIDIEINEPGVYGFLGPNGAGKTTAFKLIAGLLFPTSGRVLINGLDVHRHPRQAVADLGIGFDAAPFYPYLTGRENLVVMGKWYDTAPSSVRIAELLGVVGLTESADRRMGGYSWGMRQRLGIAASLLGDPRLLLYDEPTNGLDPRGIADIRELMLKLAREHGRTVILSSHRMLEVEAVCDQVMIIHKGRIVAAARPEDLSEGEVVEVECERPEDAARILDGLPEVTRSEVTGANRLRVVAPGLKSSRINQVLVEQGIGVEQVHRHRETLEQMFFRLTGGAGEGVSS